MAFQGDSIFWVETGKIVANPFQPRREFDEAKLKELAESVRMYGILQPLTVTRKEIQCENGAFYTEYELIAGERRLRASKLAGLEQVPVIIRSGEDTEQEKLELAIIENLQREDLNAVDRALAFKQLADAFELSHAQVAKKVGRSREYVSNSIRLLGLPECMLNSLKLGDISEGHARTLLMLKDRPEEQDVVYREILLKKLSVREVERITRKIASDKVRKKKWTDTDPELIAIEKDITDSLGTRVQISKTDFGGKLTIDYFSDEDLQKLLSLLKAEEAARVEEEEQESTTVVHEMSPEASLMAKLATATPLVLDEDEAPELQVPEPPLQEETQRAPQAEDSRHSIPMEESTPFGVFEEVPSEVQEQEHTAPAAATEKQEGTAVSGEEKTHTQAPAVSESQTEQSESNAPAASSVPEPSVEDTPKEVIESDEFAFIAKHTQEARREDLANPYEAPTPTVSEQQDREDPPEKADDEDLYSMKNFSL